MCLSRLSVLFRHCSKALSSSILKLKRQSESSILPQGTTATNWDRYSPRPYTIHCETLKARITALVDLSSYITSDGREIGVTQESWSLDDLIQNSKDIETCHERSFEDFIKEFQDLGPRYTRTALTELTPLELKQRARQAALVLRAEHLALEGSTLISAMDCICRYKKLTETTSCRLKDWLCMSKCLVDIPPQFSEALKARDQIAVIILAIWAGTRVQKAEHEEFWWLHGLSDKIKDKWQECLNTEEARKLLRECVL